MQHRCFPQSTLCLSSPHISFPTSDGRWPSWVTVPKPVSQSSWGLSPASPVSLEPRSCLHVALPLVLEGQEVSPLTTQLLSFFLLGCPCSPTQNAMPSLFFWKSTCSFKAQSQGCPPGRPSQAHLPRDSTRLLPVCRSYPLPALPAPAQPAHHIPGCPGQEHRGCRIHHCPECLHPSPLPFHLPWPLSRTPSCQWGPQQETRGAGSQSVHLGISRLTRARPEGEGHLWEIEAGLGGCPTWVLIVSAGPTLPPQTPPECWASSRRLRSVSRRASVRSRWLIRAVSTGGHEGREAGLSESWGGRGGVVNQCQEGGAGPRSPHGQAPGDKGRRGGLAALW